MTKVELQKYYDNMQEWKQVCERARSDFRTLRDAFSNDKVAKKPARVRKHDRLLAEANPIDALHKMVHRYRRLEPLHLSRDNKGWMIWARNMTICELLLSNPLRADNICMLEEAFNGKGHLHRDHDTFELRFAKHEVKNPHPEKPDGYRAHVNQSAASWLRFYISEVRPKWPLEKTATRRLFLTRSGGHLRTVDLRKTITLISQACLPEYEAINTHLFRHIIATGWLKTNPNDFVTVALILGDRIDTVLREYAHLASEDGVRRYHAAMGRKSDRSPPIAAPKASEAGGGN